MRQRCTTLLDGSLPEGKTANVQCVNDHVGGSVGHQAYQCQVPWAGSAENAHVRVRDTYRRKAYSTAARDTPSLTSSGEQRKTRGKVLDSFRKLESHSSATSGLHLGSEIPDNLLVAVISEHGPGFCHSFLRQLPAQSGASTRLLVGWFK